MQKEIEAPAPPRRGGAFSGRGQARPVPKVQKAGLFLHLLFGVNRFYFLEQFHVFGKTEQKAQSVLCNLVSPVHTTLSLTSHVCVYICCSTWIRTEMSLLTNAGSLHEQHSCCWTSCGFDRCMGSWIHYDSKEWRSFTVLNALCAPPGLPLPQILAATRLCAASMVLPFPKCRWLEAHSTYPLRTHFLRFRVCV